MDDSATRTLVVETVRNEVKEQLRDVRDAVADLQNEVNMLLAIHSNPAKKQNSKKKREKKELSPQEKEQRTREKKPKKKRVREQLSPEESKRKYEERVEKWKNDPVAQERRKKMDEDKAKKRAEREAAKEAGDPPSTEPTFRAANPMYASYH
jgi:hypothetical protein